MRVDKAVPQSIIARLATVASESFEGIEVVFDPDSGLVRKLNRTASEIWRLLEAPSTRSELMSTLSARTPQNATHIAADVLRFVDELIMWGLVENFDG